MRDLNYQLKGICRHNRDGSYATQSIRERLLSMIADQLHTLGYRGMRAQSLKPKHIHALVAQWQRESLSPGTIKNRMSALRWWAEKVNRRNVIARQNEDYGIPDRVFITNASKATTVTSADVARVTDPHARMSLELQQVFGLRREEAIKIQPVYADRGDHLVLKQSWTKGGKARVVPLLNAAQRDVLDRAHRLAGQGSLIPRERNYRQQVRIYERHTAHAGLSRMHGLRHAYAQARYAALTGWKAPAAGGPTASLLTSEQRGIDHDARLTISREMGHEREAVVAIYLGR